MSNEPAHPQYLFDFQNVFVQISKIQISPTIYSDVLGSVEHRGTPSSWGDFKQRPGEAVKLTETFSKLSETNLCRNNIEQY